MNLGRMQGRLFRLRSSFILPPSSFLEPTLERYFVEPYRFVPPFRGTFWCRIAGRLMPRHLRKKMSVRRWEFYGLEHLGGALERKSGILIASNHSRWSDPMV